MSYCNKYLFFLIIYSCCAVYIWLSYTNGSANIRYTRL